MRDKVDGPRRRRERFDASHEAEPLPLRGDAPGAAAMEPRAPIPPEFAAAVQVTETERAWIRQHLAWFLEHDLITDVVRRIKAGKEATVYACSAHPSTGESMLAAKVYREWSLRGSQNMSLYQQGRGMLDEDGNAEQSHSGRQSPASAKKSKRGKVATQTSWLMHEFTLLESLHAMGADVPRPIEHGEHVLLMQYIGSDAAAAPTLNDVELEPAEAKRLFERVIYNVEILLGLGWVHGDLSEYNIMYDRGRIVLIDFPQVADARNNPKARALFERDIARVASYFGRSGHTVDARELARELWARHISDADGEETAS